MQASVSCRIHSINSNHAPTHGESVLTGRRWQPLCSGQGASGHAQVVEDSPDIASEALNGGRDAVAALGLDQADGKAGSQVIFSGP